MDTIYWIITVCVFLYALICNIWVNGEIKQRNRLYKRLEKIQKELKPFSTKVYLSFKLVLNALWWMDSIAYTKKELKEKEEKDDAEFIDNIKKLGGN